MRNFFQKTLVVLFNIAHRGFISESRELFPLRPKGFKASIKLNRHKDAKVVLEGRLYFESSWLGNSAPVFISVGKNASLLIKGDFVLGPGCRIMVAENATLEIGGKLHESASGITENSKIMVTNRVDIGSDFLGAWNIYITDSDWHRIDNRNDSMPTSIGNHVWITPNCSILKGSTIGDNSIVANNSVVTGGMYPAGALVAGCPARVIKPAKRWTI